MKTSRLTLLLPGLATGAVLFASPLVEPDRGQAARRLMEAAARMSDELLVQDSSFLSPFQDECTITSNLATRADLFGLQQDLAHGLASCVNEESSTYIKFVTCLQELFQEYSDGIEELDAIHDARLSLCGLLGGGIYDPDLDEEDFEDVDGVDHPFLPYRTGAVWVYQIAKDDGLEEITVTVTPDTRCVDDIESIVVRDVVTLDGVLVEDTADWYAQDEDGTVWYMGEVSQNFEDGELTDLDGSWEAGEDGAQPGIVMLATPQAGVTYRQELLLGEAEDAGTVIATDVTVTIGLGTFTGCIQIEDFTPLEPDALEVKTYAPGIGLILEEKPRTGERVELVSFVPGS